MKESGKIWKSSGPAIFNLKSLTLILIFAMLYSTLSISLINYRYVLWTLLGDAPLIYKLKLFPLLFEGIFTTLSAVDTILLLITSILVGINITLLYLIAKRLKGPKTRLALGGGSVIGIISTGCTSCGFSALSVMGLGTSLTFLPFGNQTLYLISISLLTFSIINLIKQITLSDYCKLK